MTVLREQQCIPCRGDSPPVAQDDVAQLHSQIPEWVIADPYSVPKLQRSFEFRNFKEAIEFTNAVASESESRGHHPRLITEWGRVDVTWWTHKIKNLHNNDFVMAAITDDIYKHHRGPD